MFLTIKLLNAVCQRSNPAKFFYVKTTEHNFLNSVFRIAKNELRFSSFASGNLKGNLMTNENRRLSELNIKWDVLYTFPHIKILGIISRFKMYQAVIMVGIFYPMYNMHLEGNLSNVMLVYAAASSIGTGLLFIIYSYFATRVVGQLAVNQHDNVIRISHLSFYGRRIEEYVEVTKIIPMSDFMEDYDLENVFQRLYIDKGNKKLNKYVYSLRYGKVFDREQFNRLLGIPSF